MRNSKLNRLRLWTLISALSIGVLFLVFDVASGNAEASEPTQPRDYRAWAYPQGIEAYKDAPFLPGEIVVGYHADQVAAAGLNAQLGIQVLDTIDLRGLDGATGDAGVAGYIMGVAVGLEWATVERLLEEPSVAFATPNWTVQAAGIDVLENESNASIEPPFAVNDTFYADRQWYAQRINASRAWQLARPLHNAGNRPIQVAIIDSGVDVDHPELKGHLLPGWNYLNPGSPPIDDFGHGTHIAGVIAATLNNQLGIAGMAPWVEIDPYKVLNSSGGGSAIDLGDAICAAVDNGADIVNLSLTITNDNSFIREGIECAADKNVLVVAAAGNDGGSVLYPAAYSTVMAVAATDYDDKRGSYSAFGTEIEIAAPGGGVYSSQPKIFSTWSKDAISKCAAGFQEEDGSYYCDNTGTSMAASVVSGVAALVWGLDPSMPAETVRALLKDTATPLPQAATYVGSGRVDALAAVRALVPMALEPSVTDLCHAVVSDSKAFTSTIEISNPSPEILTWTAELALDDPWIQIAGIPGTAPTPAETVRYGRPGYVSLIFSPDQATVGLHVNSLVLRGEASGFTTIEVVPLSLGIDTNCLQVYYFPVVHQTDITQTDVIGGGTAGEKSVDEKTAGEEASPDTTGFEWEIPVDESDRTKFVMTDDTAWRVFLPFDFPYGEDEYRSVYLHPDGALTMTIDDPTSVLPENGCLLTATDWSASGIYGWWADLDPGQPGAIVSGFAVGSDRYVFEFFDVPSAGTVEPGYLVSFQMVLFSDGDVQINYQETPSLLDPPPLATVGLQSTDGRFRNQVFCADGTTTLRVAPGSNQSLRFTREDIY